MGGKLIDLSISGMFKIVFSIISVNNMAYVINPENYQVFDDVKFIFSLLASLAAIIYWGFRLHDYLKNRKLEKSIKDLTHHNLLREKERHEMNGEYKKLLDNDL